MKNFFVFGLLIFITLAFPLFAQQRVAIFKNNTAFFIQEKQVDASTKKTRLSENLPNATFGTLWFYAPNNRITLLQGSTQAIEQELPSGNIKELLIGNVGKSVSLVLDDDTQVQGNIITCNEALLVIKTIQGQWLSLIPQQVKRAAFATNPSLSYSQKTSKRVLDFEFARANNRQNIQMMYLQKGITWLPNYHIALQKEGKAQITLRANLLNDAEDLKNAEVNFVVGIPNFAYEYLPSPLTQSTQVADFVNTLNRRSNNPVSMARGDITRQQLSNVAVPSNYAFNETTQEAVEFEGLSGKTAEDLFFYQAKDVSIAKGGRAFVDVMQVEVDFEHIYEVALSTNQQQSSYYRQLNQENINQVWHSIRLHNNSKLPWTTGTALITKANDDGSPEAMSQDKLSYVPSGGKGKIRLTVAPNILVKDSEEEIAREENKRGKGGVRYDLVKVAAKVELKNYKDEAVKLNLSRKIIGEALKSDLAWQVNKEVQTSISFNPYTSLDWDIDLKPNESKVINYEYQIFIAR